MPSRIEKAEEGPRIAHAPHRVGRCADAAAAARRRAPAGQAGLRSRCPRSSRPRAALCQRAQRRQQPARRRCAARRARPIGSHCEQARRVSTSPNRSSATTSKPSSRAASASMRADRAATAIKRHRKRSLHASRLAGRVLDQELARHRKGLGEAQHHRLLGLLHAHQQPVLGLVLDVADRQRTDAHRRACRPAAWRRPSRRRRQCPPAARRSRRPPPSAAWRRRAARLETTCTPAAAQASSTSASASELRTAAGSPPDRPCSVTPKRLPVSRAAASATSMPLRLDRKTSAPACAAITPAMRPTGPVPPRMTTRWPSRPCAWWLLQCGLDTGHHRGRRGVGAARVGHQRDDEGLDHRRLRALHHVGRQQRVAPADEDAGARHALRAAREDGVLRQAGDGVDADLAVRHDHLVAGVGCHVDVERAHLAARGEHVEDVGAFHGTSALNGELRRAASWMCQRARGAARRSITLAPLLRPDTMRSVSGLRNDQRRARGIDHGFGLRLRRQDGEAGRAPGALADRGGLGKLRRAASRRWLSAAPSCPVAAADPFKQAAHRRTGERRTALRRCEVLAQHLLDAVDAGRERCELGACRAGQHTHQHLVADVGRQRTRQRRQCRDGVALVGARQTLVRAVLHHQHTPRRRAAGCATTPGPGRRQRSGRRRAAVRRGRSPQCRRPNAPRGQATAPSVGVVMSSRCHCANARPMASASWVPEPKPACAGSTRSRLRRSASCRPLWRRSSCRYAAARSTSARSAGPLAHTSSTRRCAEFDFRFEPIEHEPEAAETPSQRCAGVQKAQVQSPWRAQPDACLGVGEQGS